ncbi:hypothetical protein TcWFU_001504 [Taenia crassiceps]|uniref:Uncharacterized protein n=1 Tax=Taenia crassiceps TaxID=6207 RepID=A0ABR4Q1E4_9CEST
MRRKLEGGRKKVAGGGTFSTNVKPSPVSQHTPAHSYFSNHDVHLHNMNYQYLEKRFAVSILTQEIRGGVKKTEKRIMISVDDLLIHIHFTTRILLPTPLPLMFPAFTSPALLPTASTFIENPCQINPTFYCVIRVHQSPCRQTIDVISPPFQFRMPVRA